MRIDVDARLPTYPPPGARCGWSTHKHTPASHGPFIVGFSLNPKAYDGGLDLNYVCNLCWIDWANDPAHGIGGTNEYSWHRFFADVDLRQLVFPDMVESATKGGDKEDA